MKKLTKVLTLLICAAVLLSLAACSSGNSGGSGGEKEKLVMGTNAFFPPYEYYEGGDIVGIDAEIAAKLAEKLGMDLEIEDMEFDTILAAIDTGRVDIGMAGMTVTEKRLESVNFSDSYATGIQVIIVQEGSDITGPDDLEGRKIGVQLGTTGDIYASEDYGDESVERYPKGSEAVMALTAGRIDCVIIDNEPAKSFVEANEGLVILDTEYAIEDYAIAMAKDNTELLDKINTALGELIADGTVKGIIEKYIPVE